MTIEVLKARKTFFGTCPSTGAAEPDIQFAMKSQDSVMRVGRGVSGTLQTIIEGGWLCPSQACRPAGGESCQKARICLLVPGWWDRPFEDGEKGDDVQLL